MPVITYYMTVNSPWTYLGSARFAEIARRQGYSVDIKPAKFGEVFAKTGGFPLPKRSPERRAYRLMDMKRWRDHLKIPVNVEPKYFPSNEVPGTRLVLAAKLAGKDAHALATEIGKALWEKEQDIGTRCSSDRVRQACRPRCRRHPQGRTVRCRARRATRYVHRRGHLTRRVRCSELRARIRRDLLGSGPPRVPRPGAETLRYKKPDDGGLIAGWRHTRLPTGFAMEPSSGPARLSRRRG